MIKPANRWNAKLKKERISNALSAERLRKEGWTEGRIMDHFGVGEPTLQRWSKLVNEEISNV